MLTAERLRERLTYDPDTGEFRWRGRGLAGSTNFEGYRVIKIDGRSYKAHRLAWLYAHGSWPSHQIDHLNGRRDDNRLSNLRDVPHIGNCQNRHGAQRNGSSGFLGVTASGTGRWVAQIGHGGTVKYIGTFDTPEAAAAAYRTTKRSLHSYAP